MKFKEFMDLYDNWNGITVVNDDDLNLIIKSKTSTLMMTCHDLFNMEVVAFGFYDNELCVSVKEAICTNT